MIIAPDITNSTVEERREYIKKRYPLYFGLRYVRIVQSFSRA